MAMITADEYGNRDVDWKLNQKQRRGLMETESADMCNDGDNSGGDAGRWRH